MMSPMQQSCTAEVRGGVHETGQHRVVMTASMPVVAPSKQHAMRGGKVACTASHPASSLAPVLATRDTRRRRRRSAPVTLQNSCREIAPLSSSSNMLKMVVTSCAGRGLQHADAA